MHSKQQCLELIDNVLESAHDIERAYVLRSRIKRSVLSVTRLCAIQAGVPEPVLPHTISNFDCADERTAEILSICAVLMSQADVMCQPSEALDIRWKSGWGSLIERITHLKGRLRTLPQHER